MYFKINQSGCSEVKGLCQVRYDLYLDEPDHRYEEKKDTPFCCHFGQFEPEATDDEIAFVGELALEMAYGNWIKGDLSLNKNLPVQFSQDAEKKARAVARSETIKETDFTKVSMEIAPRVKE